ncbi:hypothetical protein AG1IA_04814 [Rhizoctonia solani AG-1 IA]|uniref:Uncharacterized protein n=1 Tax=Thanatephorus cucumeris (strain AG1-IA) TaxID=983506 RepID=L8WSR4_THACA|nr:hypothetical protein AG1IA_04814 [Rhizoctonia solani AG-1 IA]
MLVTLWARSTARRLGQISILLFASTLHAWELGWDVCGIGNARQLGSEEIFRTSRYEIRKPFTPGRNCHAERRALYRLISAIEMLRLTVPERGMSTCADTSRCMQGYFVQYYEKYISRVTSTYCIYNRLKSNITKSIDYAFIHVDS